MLNGALGPVGVCVWCGWVCVCTSALQYRPLTATPSAVLTLLTRTLGPPAEPGLMESSGVLMLLLSLLLLLLYN